MGPFYTPQAAQLHKQLQVIMEADVAKDGWHTKDAVAIDGLPGLGKTTTMHAFAKKFHDQQIRRHGQYTAAGDERIPVLRVGMRGNTGMTAFNRAACDYYAHPGRRCRDVDELGRRVLRLVLLCETRLLIVDDVHFLHWQRDGGVELNNHFKFIANEFPVTVVVIGIGLAERGVLRAGTAQESLAQTARNTTEYGFFGFKNKMAKQRREWRELLASVDDKIVLAHHRQGMLVEQADYLYARSGGHIGSLLTLIRRACTAAIIDGCELLTMKLFESIAIDSAAERARKELHSAYGTRPQATKIFERYERSA
ncbi:TniB family NTP-binding protein [Mycobacterium sp. MAA66]|uniref:TniB family NTP-binding protein n=1 Tax=Mycobacterium sp. MAA66 TaxID=3156297 RepID=UPI003516683B